MRTAVKLVQRVETRHIVTYAECSFLHVSGSCKGRRPICLTKAHNAVIVVAT